MNILHLDTNHPLLINQLNDLGFKNHEDYVSSKSEVEKKIKDYQGIVIRSRFRIDKSFINAATNLKFIARVGAGLENINCDYAKEKGIHLISAPEGNRNAVSEHALGMLLSLMNRLQMADNEVRNGEWNREKNRGDELDGKTVGIIGYGNTGKALAKKLRGFEVEVIFHDIEDNLEDGNAKQVSLDVLKEKADVLSLHVPLTEITNKMVNKEFINSFKKSFYLLNTARGKCVITKDLVEALQSGIIIAAGLDVLEYEQTSFENLFTNDQIPQSFQELLNQKNVILSPHIAGWTHQSKEKLSQTIVDKIKAEFSFCPTE